MVACLSVFHGIGVRFLVSFPSPTGLLSSALAFALTAVLDLCIDHELFKALKTKLKSLLVFLVFLEASPAAHNHCVVDGH